MNKRLLFLLGIFLCFSTYSQTLDNTFSGDGILTFEMGGGGSSCVHGIGVNPDGSIYLGGYGASPGGNYPAGFVLVKVKPDGTFDNSFSSDGKLIIPIPNLSSAAKAYALKLDSDGNIYLGGKTGNDAFAVAKIKPNGDLDNTFDTDGIQTVQYTFTEVTCMTLDNDGNIYLGGRHNSYTAVAKIKPNGALDNSFSGDGLLEFSPTTWYNYTIGMGLDDNGNLYIGGYNSKSAVESFIVSLKNDGSFNTDFDTDGKLILSTQLSFFTFDNANKILVGADVSPSGISLKRINVDGTFDTSFDNDGSIDITTSELTNLSDAVIDQMGNIFLSANLQYAPSKFDFSVIKILNNGSIDTNFGNGGEFIAHISDNYNGANAIVANSSGDLFLAGFTSPTYILSGDMAVIKIAGSTFITEIESATSNNFNLTIYPNPSKGSFIIDSNHSEIKKITLIDSKGIREVHYNNNVITNFKGLLIAEIELANGIVYKKIAIE